MEHIIRERVYPQTPREIQRLRLSPFLLIVVIVLVGLAVATVATMTMAQYTLPLPNPFPAYADVFPGQPASAIETRAFSCQNSYDFYHRPIEGQESTEKSCIFIPATGVF